MNFNSGKHHRHSIRLRGYDYSQPGAYFITICVWNRECVFGKIDNSEMRLNEFGEIVSEKWRWLAQQYPYVKSDEFIVMPNHFHGILWIRDIACRGGSRPAPTEIQPPGLSRPAPTDLQPPGLSRPAPKDGIKIKPVGQLIGAFKTVSAKQINNIRNSSGISVWQRDFYDRIGRDENELSRIRQYIRNNPANWNADDENPICKSPKYVVMLNPQTQYI